MSPMTMLMTMMMIIKTYRYIVCDIKSNDYIPVDRNMCAISLVMNYYEIPELICVISYIKVLLLLRQQMHKFMIYLFE